MSSNQEPEVVVVTGAVNEPGWPAGPSPVPGPPRMRQVLDAIPPASGAIVMASGIVSIDLYSDHQPVLSAILLWFAAGVWLLLAIMLGMRLAYQRDRFAREAISPRVHGRRRDRRARHPAGRT